VGRKWDGSGTETLSGPMGTLYSVLSVCGPGGGGGGGS
jgi:hypothetical protein